MYYLFKIYIIVKLLNYPHNKNRGHSLTFIFQLKDNGTCYVFGQNRTCLEGHLDNLIWCN